MGENMTDTGDYYQCPRCNDVKPKCNQDAISKFQKALLKRREPTPTQRVWNVLTKFRTPITCGVLLAFLVWGLMILQINGG